MKFGSTSLLHSYSSEHDMILWYGSKYESESKASTNQIYPIKNSF